MGGAGGGRGEDGKHSGGGGDGAAHLGVEADVEEGEGEAAVYAAEAGVRGPAKVEAGSVAAKVSRFCADRGGVFEKEVGDVVGGGSSEN